MTVAELIEKLREMPPDLPVMADDYEEGAYDVREVAIRDYPQPRHVVIT